MVNLQRDNLLGIANSLNEAVFNQNMWGDALQHMADCFGGSFATFEIFNKQTGLHSQHFDSSDIEIRDEYLSHYMPLNPRIAFGNLPDTPSVMHDHLFMGENDMDRCEFYADFLSEFDLRYFLAVKAFESKDEFGVFTIQKSASGGGATNDEIHAIHNLAPFLNNIAKFQLQQGSLFRRLNDLECLLEADDKGVLFLDKFGSITELNSIATNIMTTNDGIYCSNGKLVCSDGKASKKLESALSKVDQDFVLNNPGYDVLVPRPSGLPPYQLRVQSLENRIEYLSNNRRTTFLVFIKDPALECSIGVNELVDGFGLTLAEASVALSIAKGRTAHNIARDTGVSMATVRTHIQRIMQKMSANKQADIVRILSRYF